MRDGIPMVWLVVLVVGLWLVAVRAPKEPAPDPLSTESQEAPRTLVPIKDGDRTLAVFVVPAHGTSVVTMDSGSGARTSWVIVDGAVVSSFGTGLAR